jgi:endonuclease G, mitochondrial
MDKLPRAIEDASSRLIGKLAQAKHVHDFVEAQRVRYLDPENLSKRVERLLKTPLIEQALAARGVADELRRLPDSVEALSPAAQGELERILGSAPNFLPIWFLTRGAELRRTVVRVRAKTGAKKEKKGTGFLVGPRLLLTNSHVLDWSDIGEERLDQIAPFTDVEFDFEEQTNGSLVPASTFRLDPDTLLLQSPWNQLDYVLVAVRPVSNDGQTSISVFGYNRLAGDTGKINKGEPVFIVQHPAGQPKQVVIQNNRLIDRDELVPYLTYEADTDVGSSGAPVYNRQWEVVALHHSPQIDRDELGNIRLKDGRVQFLKLNEGIRVSRLMDDWAKKLQAIEAGNRPVLPELVSEQGRGLLQAALATHLGAPPPTLVAPMPMERSRTVPPAARGGFPRPD